eukprot:SAG22_NODE_4850_length_1151_cov_0.721483_2_plen_76_part_01
MSAAHCPGPDFADGIAQCLARPQHRSSYNNTAEAVYEAKGHFLRQKQIQALATFSNPREEPPTRSQARAQLDSLMK